MTRAADIRAELIRRTKKLHKIESDGAHGHALAMRYYKTRPVDWINDWVWTYDPRAKRQGLQVILPMRLVPTQVQFAEWVIGLRKDGKNGWAGKGRGVGFSYIVIAILLHAWTFEDSFSASLVSETEDKIDKKDDPDTLFEKARIILRHLPRWMLPEGFRIGGEYDNHRRLVNPANRSAIAGRMGRNAGRGGRCSIAIVDEADYVSNLISTRRALYQVTDTTIEISTFQSPQLTPFARSVERGGPRVFPTTNYKAIPWYDDAWLEEQREKFIDDPQGFALEILADRTADDEDVVIPQRFVTAAVDFDQWAEGVCKGLEALCVGVLGIQLAADPAGLDDVSLDLGTVAAGQDVAGDGGNENALAVRDSSGMVPTILPLFVRTEGNTVATTEWALDILEGTGASVVYVDEIGIGAGVLDMQTADSPSDLRVVGFNAGSTPTNYVWPSGRLSKQRFFNLRAEAWWHVRDRLRKTWEVREGIRAHPLHECISLPDDIELRRQLSAPRFKRRGGKILIESKDDMRKRGLQSPDRADAVIMAEAVEFMMPRRPRFWF